MANNILRPTVNNCFRFKERFRINILRKRAKQSVKSASGKKKNRTTLEPRYNKGPKY